MTKLTFNLVDNSTQKVITSDIKTYPEAQELASEYVGDCTIKSVYTETELKEKTKPAKNRLVARA